MAKIKMAKKPPRIDMTPMVDLFFLLLVFFILTATFRVQESFSVDSPTSTSETVAPEAHIITISVTGDNEVYFNMDNGSDSSEHLRGKILEAIGQHYNMTFTDEEVETFEVLNSFSLPMEKMHEWINAGSNEIRDEMSTGIPMDSTDNQLMMWIRFSRQYHPDYEVILKGDQDADYEEVKKVIDILQDNNVNKFNLITTLRSVDVSLENL